jgi:hypothetical protein
MYTDAYAQNLESVGHALAGLAILPGPRYVPECALYRDTHKRTFGNLDVHVLHGKFSAEKGVLCPLFRGPIQPTSVPSSSMTDPSSPMTTSAPTGGAAATSSEKSKKPKNPEKSKKPAGDGVPTPGETV